MRVTVLLPFNRPTIMYVALSLSSQATVKFLCEQDYKFAACEEDRKVYNGLHLSLTIVLWRLGKNCLHLSLKIRDLELRYECTT
jgi:hypothetical protein